MSERELMAYALLAALLVAVGCWIAWHRYHSRERSYRRQKQRDTDRYRDRMAAEEAPGDASRTTKKPRET